MPAGVVMGRVSDEASLRLGATMEEKASLFRNIPHHILRKGFMASLHNLNAPWQLPPNTNVTGFNSGHEDCIDLNAGV